MVTARGSVSPVGLAIEVEGEVLISRTMSRFMEGVEDFSPAFEKMRDEMYAIEQDQFSSQGGHSGGWDELKPRTAKRKGSSVIMVATRRLFVSLTEEGGDNIATITPTEFSFGTRVFYAVYHQSPKPRTVIPRRQLIALTEEDKKILVKILQAYLVGVAREAEASTRSLTSLTAQTLDIMSGGPA